MNVAELKVRRRSDAEWNRFMSGLNKRMRGRRRARGMAWLAAAALALACAGALWRLPAAGPAEPPLRADVPTSSSPLFTPANAVAFPTPGGAVLIVVSEVRA